MYTPAFECAAFRHGEEASAARVAKSTKKNEKGKKGEQKPSTTCLTHFQEEQVALHKKNQRARKRRVWREKASERKITKIFFDRGIYKYHGRVKVFAETLRKNGMEF